MRNRGNTFGDTAFSGSRFIFWAIAPILLISGLTLPFLLGDWNPTKIIVCATWCACSLLAIPALYDARKFWWAARSVTGLIVLAYGWYIVDEFFFSDHDFGLIGPTSDSSPRNAIWGFLVIGLPCLWYTIFGRFSLSPENDSWEDFDDEVE